MALFSNEYSQENDIFRAATRLFQEIGNVFKEQLGLFLEIGRKCFVSKFIPQRLEECTTFPTLAPIGIGFARAPTPGKYIEFTRAIKVSFPIYGF